MKLRSLLGCCLLMGAGAAAHAQILLGYDPAVDLRERARIQDERVAAERQFGIDEAGCYQRFAVYDCLRDSRRRRRTVMEELHRQEVILNDLKRTSEALDERRRIEERMAERDGAEAQAQRDSSRRAFQEHQQQVHERQEEAAQREQSAVPGRPEAVAVPDATPAGQRNENQRNYDEKVQKAQEHLEEHERELSRQGPSTSKPLPVPP